MTDFNEAINLLAAALAVGLVIGLLAELIRVRG